MKRSWRTTLCGVLATAFTAAAQTPDLNPGLAHILATIGGLMGGIGLLFARDAVVSSEAQGVAPTPIIVEGKTPTTTT